MGRRAIEITGQIFGRWTVLSKAESKDGSPMWVCRCLCGVIRSVAGCNLRSGHSQSCGCERIEKVIASASSRSAKRPMDFTGQTFGYWCAIELAKPRGKLKYWLCQCRCGTQKEISGNSLRAGTSKSCGCLRDNLLSSRQYQHGLTDHPIWSAWQHMKDRCQNPRNSKWEYYGGRGITVCERWQDFLAFAADMHPTWKSGLTLDRINTNGNYEPTNCQWATRSEQMQNTRRNKTKYPD